MRVAASGAGDILAAPNDQPRLSGKSTPHRSSNVYSALGIPQFRIGRPVNRPIRMASGIGSRMVPADTERAMHSQWLTCYWPILTHLPWRLSKQPAAGSPHLPESTVFRGAPKNRMSFRQIQPSPGTIKPHPTSGSLHQDRLQDCSTPQWRRVKQTVSRPGR